MLVRGGGIEMNRSLAAHYFKLSADQGVIPDGVYYAECILRGDVIPIDLRECEQYLRFAVERGNQAGQMLLGLCLFSGRFGRFDLTEARDLFAPLSVLNAFAAILWDSISASDSELVCALDFARNGNIFSVLRSSFDDAKPLIRVLLDPNDCACFAAWQEIAGHSLPYLIDLSHDQSHSLRSLPSDLLLCHSISSMLPVIFQMYTIDSSLYKNVNQFLRCFPISMVSKFMRELRGIVSYIYLLQSSIESRSHVAPIRENFVVYRGIQNSADQGMFYESMIGDVVVWCGFTSTSTDRDYVVNEFITDDDCVLFEIELHPDDVAVFIERDSEYEFEREVLIAASTGFQVLSVDYTDVSICGECDESVHVHLPIVKLSYFLHWYDFDLDQCPPRVLALKPALWEAGEECASVLGSASKEEKEENLP
jgi:hypothetical protein